MASAVEVFSMNWLELEAIRLALVAFNPLMANRHVLVMCDNKTVIVYINKRRYQVLLAKSILLWCWTTDNRVLCHHIPGRLNVKANLLSWKSQVVATEWSLYPCVVESI